MLATKNPFANTPPLASVPAVEATVKGKQLLRGRTKARVESLPAELDAARLSFAQAEQTLGERMVDDLDATTATEAVRQVGDRVRVLESALAVARQRDDAAQASLKQAEQQVAIEAEVEVVARLKRVSLKADRLLNDLERLVVDELGPSLNEARGVLSKSAIRDGELNFLPKLPLVFKQLLLLSVHTLIQEGFVPVNMRAYEKLSECIPDSDFIRSRERPGPSPATPISGWQIGA
jgi:hypothetical protein